MKDAAHSLHSWKAGSKSVSVVIRLLATRVIESFRRETLSTRYIPELDGLRCVAVLMVSVFHLNGYLQAKNEWGDCLSWMTAVLGNGYFGVEIFFLISGYIVLLPFAPVGPCIGRRPDLLVFYVRRMVRIWPPYVIAMTIFLGAKSVLDGGLSSLIPGYIASLGYLHNLCFGAASDIVVVAWTLEVEVQFYAFAPALALVFLIRPPWVRRALIAIGIGLGSLGSERAGSGLNILPFLPYFLCGMLLADLGEGRPLNRSYVGDLFAATLLPVLVWLVFQYGARGVFVPTALMLTVAAVCQGTVCSHLLLNRWVRAIGTMCFSIYLLHYPVISFTGRILRGILPPVLPPLGAYVLQGGLITVCVIGVSAGYFAFVEKPFMKRQTTDAVIGFLQRLRLAR